MLERIGWFGEDAKSNQLSAKPNKRRTPNRTKEGRQNEQKKDAKTNKRKMPKRTGGKPNKDGRKARKELIAWTGGYAGAVNTCRMVRRSWLNGKSEIMGEWARLEKSGFVCELALKLLSFS